MSENMHYAFDDYQVRLVLPHRPPMLLVDYVPDCSPALDRLQAVKQITLADPMVARGNGGQRAFFPPTLSIEALAQTCGLLMKLRWLEAQDIDIKAFAAGDDTFVKAANIPPSVLADTRARQLRLIRAGDTLSLSVRLTLQRGQTAMFTATAANAAGVCTELEVQLAFPEYTLRLASAKK